MKIIADNKKAFHDYFIEERVNAGIALVGSEVKSIRQGKVNLKDSYAIIKNNEVFLFGCHIATYEKTTVAAEDTRRTRKLLLNRSEITKIERKIKEKNFTLIPLKVYLSDNGKVKVELGLAKGKKLYEKKEVLKQRDLKKEAERAVINRK